MKIDVRTSTRVAVLVASIGVAGVAFGAGGITNERALELCRAYYGSTDSAASDRAFAELRRAANDGNAATSDAADVAALCNAALAAAR